MKRSELFFGAALVPIDFAMLLGAGLAAYFLRLSPTIQRFRPALFTVELPLTEYLELVSVVAVVIITVFAANGLYAMQATRRPLDELTRIFSGVSIGVMLVIVYMFLQAELFDSRFILLMAYVLAIIFVAVGRSIIRRVQGELLAKGMGIHRVVLVGNGRYAAQLAHIFRSRPQLGYRVVGMPEQARAEELKRILREHGIDEMIQTDPTMPEEYYLVLLDFCEQHKIDFKYVPNLFETHAANVRYRLIGGAPVVELLKTPLDGWGRVAKRLVDIFGAVVGLVFFSPILLLTAVAIKLDSAGGVFFKQTRVGRHKKPFKIYKFRSMYTKFSTGEDYGGKAAEKLKQQLAAQQNERSGPLFKMKNDPRITPVGKFIRRWRIDELPQFINVLKGEMSLLGPRPHLQSEVAKYSKHHEPLFEIKPGMSGMAQVNGNAGLSFEQEASLDLNYIESWSLKLDAILLVKTFMILLGDRNAV